MRKGSLEVTFFPSVCPAVCPSANFAKFNFFKIELWAPHMAIYGAQVERKWTGSGLEVKLKGSFIAAAG